MKKLHYILFVLSLLVAGWCGYGMLHVRVNSDMTKYLPSDSPMARGVHMLMNEFPGTDVNMGSVQVMFHGDSTRSAVLQRLKTIEAATSVNCQLSSDSAYTLYTILLPGDANLAPITRQLKSEYPAPTVIESTQDGVTPPISAIVIAGILVAVVLLVMAQSWLDPLLFLLTIGLAVVINMGSNALLPSVSVTTNYIVAILQLVLALDYAIILMNRYRQEYEGGSDLVTAVNTAIRRAYPSILSSSLTTVVGLAMLCFMRLKIGIDLGVVLAKGVVCCLICTFTVMPALILMCHRWLERTRKPTMVIPTDKIAILAARYKYPIATMAAALFVGTYFYSRQTNIYFCTSGESTISRIFPKVNPVVVFYPTAEEQTVIRMADTLLTRDYVTQIVSYPTLLRRPYTSVEMYEYVNTLSLQFAEYLPEDLDMSMLSPDVVQMLYYLRSGAADSLQVKFGDLIRFIHDDCLVNPLFQPYLTDEMRDQATMLETMIEMSEQPVVEQQPVRKMAAAPILVARPVVKKIAVAPIVVNDTIWPEMQTQAITPDIAPIAVAPVISQLPTITADSVPFVHFIRSLQREDMSPKAAYLISVTDTALLYRPMDVNTMSLYIGSTPTQTSFIYRMGKHTMMTPHDYVRYLTDDLFQRPALAGMVSKQQKNQLLTIAEIMTYAERDTAISALTISNLLQRYGLTVSPAQVLAVAGQGETKVHHAYASAGTEQHDVIFPEREVVQKSMARDSIEVVVHEYVPMAPVEETQDQATLFVNYMRDSTALTAAEMAQRFTTLDYDLDEPMLHLLYAYYGHSRFADPAIKATPEQLLNYAIDTLLTNPVLASHLDSATYLRISNGRESMNTAISMIRGADHSIMAILTSLPLESPQTYDFIHRLRDKGNELFQEPFYMIGESVMYDEMKSGFQAELNKIAWLTILAIFLIVALTFRSVFIPTILIVVVMTAVYVDVIFSGLISGGMLYLAYLISQSILMGATIDYGILYTNYYREARAHHSKAGSARCAYRGSIRTIMTSGTIMTLAPGAMAMLVDDVTISSIVMCIAIGACAAIVLILFVVPGLLDACDRWVIGRRK